MGVPAWADVVAEKDALILRAFIDLPTWYEEKIRARLLFDGSCLLWPGKINSRGYGKVKLPKLYTGNTRMEFQVHRVAYLAECGAIPYGFEPDHLCRVPACARPDHLEAVTHRENVRRGDAYSGLKARQINCKRGHPLDGNNLYVDRTNPDGRVCLVCRRDSAREASRAVVRAAKALGLTKTIYVPIFGQSRYTAENILSALDKGVSPESILAHPAMYRGRR